MRRPKSPAVIIGLLSMLVVAAIVVVHVLSNVRSAWGDLPKTLSAAISEQVKGKFSVGRVDVSVGGAVFRDVSLTMEGDSKPIVDAEAVKVRFGLADLIANRRDPVRAIDSVEIIRPSVSVERGADGRWNVADLLKPSARRPHEFKGRVVITSGRVTVLDRKIAGKPQRNALSNVGGVIDFTDPKAAFRVTAEGSGGHVGRISAKGRYDLESASFDADFEGLSADVSYWTKYPFHMKFMDVSSGAFDARGHVSSGKGKPFRCSAECQVTDAAVQLKMMQSPARHVRGLVKLVNNEVGLSLRASLGSTPFLVSGKVIGLRGSKLAVDLQSDRADFREISRLVSVIVPKGMVLPTSGSALIALSGPSKKPTALFKLAGPTFIYKSLTVGSVRAEGSYSPQHVDIRRATGSAYGGSVEASGEFGWGPRKGISLHGSASGVRLSQVTSLKGRGIDALTSGHFGLEWGASSGLGTYRGTMTDGIVHGQKFLTGALAVSYDGVNVHLDEVSAELFGGKVAASGDVLPNGDLDLEVSGAGIDVGALQELYWSRPTVGTLQFDGRLQGTPESPAFSGQVEAYRVMSKGISAERISADLEATRRLIRLHSLEISDPAGRIVASGEIASPFSSSPRLDLSLSIENLDIERWAASAGLPFELMGSLSADLKVTRTLPNPYIEGSMRIDNGRVADVPLDSVGSRVTYQNDRLNVAGFEARSGNGVLTADGGFGFKDGDVRLDFDARDLPLDKLTGSMREYVLLSGGLDAHGELTGSLENAVVKANLDSSALEINGQGFDAFQADLSWADDKLRIEKASFTSGAASYSVSGDYSQADDKLDLTAEAKNAPIEKLVQLVQRGPQSRATASLRGYVSSLPQPCRGLLGMTVTGGIDLSGPRPVPNLQVQGDVSDADVGLSGINTVLLAGVWHGETISLDKFEAFDGDTRLTAGGVFGPDGRLDLHADARSLDLASVATWLKLDQNISGAADVSITAEGTAESPSVQVNLDIRNPAIENMKFDSLHASLSARRLSEGGSPQNRINIDALTIVLGSSQLDASGYLPVDWTTHSIPRDKEILVEAALNDDSLKLLSAFAGGVIQGEAGGRLSGKVSYGGTIDQPSLQGGLQWRDGSVRLAGLNEPFDQIDADVSLSGHTLSADSLTGRSAEGGSFRISGHVDLLSQPEQVPPGTDGLQAILDLSLATSDLRVSGKDISARYGENINAVFDSNLKFAGEWLKPHIAGEVSVPRGSIGIGSIGDARKSAGRRFDPGFDLRVSLGREVVLKTAQLQTALPGSLSVGGSLSEPIVDGLLELADGTISFPMRTFKILPGSDMQVRMSPGQPVLVLVDMQARGSVVDIPPLGKRTKYTVTMQATGPLDKLRPTFTSSPVGLSEQRIMALVTGQYHFEQILSGNSGQDVGKELSGLFSSAVMPTVFGPLEQAFREAFGLDEFALEMGYQQPVELSIGNQLGHDTYLSYSAVLGARPDYADSSYQLKLSYRIRNNLEIGVQTDENRTLQISTEGKIRF